MNAGSFSLAGPPAFLTAGECGASGRMIWCGIVPVYNGTYLSGRGLLASSCALRLSSDGFLAGVWQENVPGRLARWVEERVVPARRKQRSRPDLSVIGGCSTNTQTHPQTETLAMWRAGKRVGPGQHSAGVYRLRRAHHWFWINWLGLQVCLAMMCSFLFVGAEEWNTDLVFIFKTTVCF